MKATRLLHNLGQSLWLDNIMRDLLTSGMLKRYIDELSVTELTSNPTIFNRAIKSSTDYDDAIRKKVREGKSGERLFFELALEDLTPVPGSWTPAIHAGVTTCVDTYGQGGGDWLSNQSDVGNEVHEPRMTLYARQTMVLQ